MKHLKLFALFGAIFLFTPLFAGFDCECSFSDGDGGHYTIGYDCGGDGEAVLQHWTWDNDGEYANNTQIVANPGLDGPC